jgi:hypothetical protein
MTRDSGRVTRDPRRETHDCFYLPAAFRSAPAFKIMTSTAMLIENRQRVSLKGAGERQTSWTQKKITAPMSTIINRSQVLRFIFSPLTNEIHPAGEIFGDIFLMGFQRSAADFEQLRIPPQPLDHILTEVAVAT